ncbi:hypothetical protein F5I97DRAFT_1875293 [Phlebopus sp. FC_14]|nr:hypothetical protein F5I97DRAFT_1875293 [Phlebopus sp. FC_14]
MVFPSLKKTRPLSYGYALPLTNPRVSSSPVTSYSLTRRALRLLVITLTCTGICLLWAYVDAVQHVQTSSELAKPSQLFNSSIPDPPLPPLYEEIRKQERNLSHYGEYEGKPIKYFWAANHAHSSGWGNVMQDYIMMGSLAHATKRSFVFDDFVWNPNGSLFTDYNGKLIPSRTPLSALLSGPMVGGPMPPGDDTPRAVSKDFFYKACPNPTVLHVPDINTDEMRHSDDIPASYVFEKWVEKINSVEDPCLMIDPSNNQIFEYWFFGQKNRMLSIWPYLSKSPVTTHWGWSPLIHDAYYRNRHLFRSKTIWEFIGIGTSREDPISPIPGLLALHIRRGDFEGHCRHLANWNAEWNAFNSFPEFPDKFEPPTDGDGDHTTQENMDLYVRRCYPTVEQIVARVRQIRNEAKVKLRYLYVLTNGPVPWVEELKLALAQDMHWAHVASSRDLELTWEQKFVAQGMDMYVAQRASVFIGNGWSSLTSNVVMLRMVHGYAPETNRFW